MLRHLVYFQGREIDYRAEGHPLHVRHQPSSRVQSSSERVHSIHDLLEEL